MDTGGWLLISEFLNALNSYVFAWRRRNNLPPLSIKDMAMPASDGTEGLTKLCWQFSVVIRSAAPRRNTPFYECIVRTLGIRAIVGQTVAPFLEDNRLPISMAALGDEMFPRIVHNTYISNIASIILMVLSQEADVLLRQCTHSCLPST